MTQRYGETQKRIIAYIQGYKVDPLHNGFSPTYREIAEDLECAHSTIYNAVQRIVARNRPNKPCEIDLDDKGRIVVMNIEVVLVKKEESKRLQKSLEHL